MVSGEGGRDGLRLPPVSCSSSPLRLGRRWPGGLQTPSGRELGCLSRHRGARPHCPHRQSRAGTELLERSGPASTLRRRSPRGVSCGFAHRWGAAASRLQVTPLVHRGPGLASPQLIPNRVTFCHQAVPPTSSRGAGDPGTEPHTQFCPAPNLNIPRRGRRWWRGAAGTPRVPPALRSPPPGTASCSCPK